MTMRFIKQGVIALGLLISVQSAWAVCEAEREIYLGKIRSQAFVVKSSDYDHSRATRGVLSDERLLIERLQTARVEDMEKQIVLAKNAIEERRQRKWGQIAASNKQEHEAIKERLVAESEFYYCIRVSLLSNARSKNAAAANAPQPNNTNAEQLSQQSKLSQQIQLQSQQSQQLAQQNQARADQQRQGKRKTHNEAAQAHSCIEIDKEPGLFGAFKNTCEYKVNFYTCNYKPKVKEGGFNWSADFDCEKNKFGLHTPDGGRSVAAHNRNTEMVYWFACKDPSWPVDSVFVVGKGIEARCH